MGGSQAAASSGVPQAPAPTPMTDPSATQQNQFFGSGDSGSAPVDPNNPPTPTYSAGSVGNAPAKPSLGMSMLQNGLSALSKTLGQTQNAPYRPPQQTALSVAPTPVAPSTSARYGTSLANRNQNQGY